MSRRAESGVRWALWRLILAAAFLAAIAPETYAAEGEGEAAADPATGGIDDRAAQRLAATCRLWGTVRYLHPYLAYKDVDWDKALVEALPAIIDAADDAAYLDAVDRMLSALDDPATWRASPPAGTRCWRARSGSSTRGSEPA